MGDPGGNVMSPNSMVKNAARHMAWTIWTISLALLAIGVTIQAAATFVGRPAITGEPNLLQELLIAALQVIVATFGTLIISRHGRNPIGWIFLALGFLLAVGGLTTGYASASLPGRVLLIWFGSLTQGPLLFGAFAFVFLLFPSGHLLSSRWRPVAWGAASALVLATISDSMLPGPLQSAPSIRNPVGIRPLSGLLHATMEIAFWGVMLMLILSAASLVLRFRRARGEERLQLKWVASAAILAALLLLSGPIFWFVLPPWLGQWWPAAFFLAAAVIPFSIGVAVLKYRLYDIDFLINRALVYGGLTGGSVALYILVVGYLGSRLHAGNNLGISLLATGLVAVLFQPLRERLQQGVNRLMYGERDDPYGVISRLGHRLEETVFPGALLPTVVETVAQALKLPYAAIGLGPDDDCAIVAAVGVPVGEPLSLPLVYQQERIGQLLLAQRAPGESLSPADLRLLADLARQASIAAHAVRLTADLQRSRERLVTAREEERRRLRRDLHDGLGPDLAAQTLKVGSARALYPRDPASADALLAELERDMEASLANVRRLVYNLRPPALDELGLVGALEDSAAQYRRPAGASGAAPSIQVDAPADLPDLPAAIEVAAYRIAQEALVNVVRHAHATSCRIGTAVASESGTSTLELSIVDDGIGLPAEHKAGVGLASMRERAAELGGTLVIEPAERGGTRVCARLPISFSPLASAPDAAPRTDEGPPVADLVAQP